MTRHRRVKWGGGLGDKSIYTLACFICSHGLCSRLPIQACLPGKRSVTKKKFPQLEVGLKLRRKVKEGGVGAER